MVSQVGPMSSQTGELTRGRLEDLGVSLVAQLVKNLPAMQEIPVQPLGGEDPLKQG